MKKTLMLIGILSILATNAQAEYWTDSLNYTCPTNTICCYL